MCLLCSGVFCCVPFKALGVCWPSVTQVNGKDIPKSDQEETMEAFRAADEPIIVEVLRRTAHVTTETNSVSKASVKPNMSIDIPMCSAGVVAPKHAFVPEKPCQQPGDQREPPEDLRPHCEEEWFARDAATQTEWIAGWETLPTTFLTVYGTGFHEENQVHACTSSNILREGALCQPVDESVSCSMDLEGCREVTSNTGHTVMVMTSPCHNYRNIVNGSCIQATDVLRSSRSRLEEHAQDNAAVSSHQGDEEHKAGSGKEETEHKTFICGLKPDGGPTDNAGFVSSSESISPRPDEGKRNIFLTTPPVSSTRPKKYRSLPRRSKDDWSLGDKKGDPDQKRSGSLQRYQSDTSLDREMALLSQEMANIQQECEVLVNRHLHEQRKAKAQRPEELPSPKSAFRNAERVSDDGSATDCWGGQRSPQPFAAIKWRSYGRSSAEEEKDSSSAYNTGDSWSTPADIERSLDGDSGEVPPQLPPPPPPPPPPPLPPPPPPASTTTTVRKGHYCIPLTSSTYSLGAIDAPVEDGTRYSPRKGSPCRCKMGSAPKVRHVTFSPGTIMYTNEAHLHHTIWLQQQLLQRALGLNGFVSGQDRQEEEDEQLDTFPQRDYDHTSYKERWPSVMNTGSAEDEAAEWKVKRRADGTRYITRRPARSRILKERAIRISEERCGLTTDDDVVSEMKLGRYWPKEDRKRHLEKSRERKQKELIRKAKNGGLGRQWTGHDRRQLLIQEEGTGHHLSSLSRSRRGSGECPGLQQLLAAARKSPVPKIARSPGLLSVTTV